MISLSKQKKLLLRKLNTPNKIQDYLDSISFNFEEHGVTCMSPVRVLQEKKAHCLEGAMFAAWQLSKSGEKPLILNLKVSRGDDDHAVALYKKNGYWGAISKTNHNVLRFRDPVYKTVRELALSYFHEYFLVSTGKKTLLGYSRPINLNRFGNDWMSREDDMWDIGSAIFHGKHTMIVPIKNKKYLRKTHQLERKAASIPEWEKQSLRQK